MNSSLTPFSESRYKFSGYELKSLEAVDVLVIAETLSKMDPWKTLDYGADELAKHLLITNPLSFRFVISGEAGRIGVVCVSYPWLRGSYLDLLAIFEPFQGMSIGRQVIKWLETQTKIKGKNIWALVSNFNKSARKFYQKMGFNEVAILNDLVKPGYDEILIRKILK